MDREDKYFYSRFYGEKSRNYIIYLAVYLLIMISTVIPTFIAGYSDVNNIFGIASVIYVTLRLSTSLVNDLKTPGEYFFGFVVSLMLGVISFKTPIISLALVVPDIAMLFVEKGLLTKQMRGIASFFKSVKEAKPVDVSDIEDVDEIITKTMNREMVEVYDEEGNLDLRNIEILSQCEIHGVKYMRHELEGVLDFRLEEAIIKYLNDYTNKKPSRLWVISDVVFMEYIVKGGNFLIKVTDSAVFITRSINGVIDYSDLSIQFSDINAELYNFYVKVKESK